VNILIPSNGVVGRFRTYKGYELRQRPVPILDYGSSGSFANLLTTTSIVYNLIFLNARDICVKY